MAHVDTWACLRHIYQDLEMTPYGEVEVCDGEIVRWDDPRPQPTNEEIAAAWEALQSAPPPVHQVITAAEFRDRFTAAEQAAFMRLALSDDTAAVILLRLSTASAGLDLASASVRAGLDHLTSHGVLTAERAAEILSGATP